MRDKKLMLFFANEKYQCPEDISLTVDSILDELKSSNKRKKKRNGGIFIRLAAIICVMTFFLLPNINSSIAYAMQDLPVVGEIVKVITVRKYEKDDEYHPQKVQIPGILQEGEAAEFINTDIKELTDKALLLFKQERDQLPDSHTGIIIDYKVVTNTPKWFTLELLIHNEAGSSTTEYKYYHINKSSGKSATLSSIFQEDFDYVSILSENISAQMRKRNEQLGDNVYWVDNIQNPQWSFTNIDPEQSFYFDESGTLTIVFGKYQIAPGYMGTPAFQIPLEIYEHELVIVK